MSVDLARKMLLHDKTRFVITVVGVAFAVTLVVVQIGLLSNLLGNATVTIEHARADLWITSKNTPNIDFGHLFPESHIDRIRGVPGVARADNLIVFYMPVTLPTGAEETAVLYAMDDLGAWGLPWDVADGNVDDLRRGSDIFLDDSATARFGPFAVGETREIAGNRTRIVGRTRGAKSFTTMPILFMRTSLAQDLAPALRGSTMYAVVKLAPGADVDGVARELRRRLPFNDVYTKDAWAVRTRDYWVKSTGLGMGMWATTFLGCLIGVVVVAQTLYAATLEHLREFGTVKAIGGTNRDIYLILLKQAWTASVAGFAVGMATVLAIRAVVRRVGLDLQFGADLLAAVFAGTVIMCCAAAAVSFRKVASIDPAMLFRG